MRRKSLLVRTILVCLFLAGFHLIGSAQTDRTPEGSLRIAGTEKKPGGLCPLKKTEVRGEIAGFVSHVAVTQIFQNPYDRAIEAVYTFPLPNDAAVNNMTIQIGNRVIRGKILERQKAQETYDKAKQEGKVAALLEQQRPNIFTQAVANITPGAEIKVVIEYVETLKYADDTYEFRFPMTIGERYIPSSVDADDARRISPKSKLRPGHTISIDLKIDAGVPIQGIYSTSHQITDQQFSGTEHRIALRDDNEIPNRDFVLRYKTAGTKLDDAVLATKDGNGGYFTLILQPPDKVLPADTMPKEIVFVLDTSGSMSGFPIAKAKEAMNLTLDDLNPSDTFNVITFAGDTKIVFEKPVPASKENLAAAKKALDESEFGGGTEMMKAIRAALEPSDASDHIRIVCFMTDGQVGNDNEIIAEVQRHANARVFAFGIGDSVNHFLLDEISREGRGDVEYVSTNDDGSAAAKRFYERIRNPLLTDIQLEFDGVEATDVLPKAIPDVFDAKPVTVVGRYTKGGRGKIILKGMMQGLAYQREIAIDLPDSSTDNGVISTLWARRQVADLMRRDYTGAQSNSVRKDVKEAITDLGLTYRLVTPFTSFVAVDEQIVTDGSNTRRVDVPTAQPVNSAEQMATGSGTGYGSGSGNASTYGPPINAQNYPPNPPGVGVASMSVEVTSSADTSQTSSGSTVLTEQQIQNLPLNGRSTQSLVLLRPGTSAVTNGTNKEQPSLNGTRSETATFTVDGTSANLGVQPVDTSLSRNLGNVPALTASGSTTSVLAADASQEFNIRTSSSAEFGRTSGTQISVISRSGTNDFRGSMFETFGNDKLNANDPFAAARNLTRAPARLNQFGGTFGGPLLRDKLFFFGNYEGLRVRKPGFAISEVPTIASRQAATPMMASVLNAFAIPNGPTTSPGLAEFAATFANSASHDTFGFRLDHQWGNNFRWWARANQTSSDAMYHGGDGFALNVLKRLDTSTTMLNGEGTYTLSPNVLISGRLNYSRNRIGQRIWLDDLGGAVVDPILSGTSGFIRYDFATQSASLASGGRIASEIGQVEPAFKLLWISGPHSFAFGAEYRRVSFTAGAQPFERNVLFSGLDDGGSASRIIEIDRAPAGSRSASNSTLFVQDDWRLRPDLTLNFGLRWETSFAPSFPDVTSPLAGNTARMSNRLGDLAPRAGIAYDLFGKGRWVFRAGAGLYLDQSNLSMSDSFANSYPFASGRYVNRVPFDASALNDFTPWTLFSNELKTPRTWQTYAEFTQELFRNVFVTTAYQGMYGRDLLVAKPFAQTVDDAFIARTIDNSGRSTRHAGVLTVEKRMSSGFSINGRYTYAKSIDNFSADPSKGILFYGSNERGPSDMDVRHDVSIFGSYRLPQFFNSGWRKAAMSGWTISAFFNARTAFPLNVTMVRANDFWDELVRPDVVAGVPLYLDVDGQRSINAAAFSLPPVGQQGTLGRNSLRGRTFRQVDVGLSRQIRFAGDSSLLLKIEALNLFNTTNLADMEAMVGTAYSDGSFTPNYYFGQSLGAFGAKGFLPTYLYGGARNIQLSAKFIF